MKYGMEVFREQKPAWDRDRIEWKLLRFVHEDFFKYHGYIIDEKSGEIAK
jgi:hypothetical protein